MKVIALPEYCLGCGLCEISCAAYHDAYKGNVIKAFKRGKPYPRSRLMVNWKMSWLNTCMHCDDAPCMNACISGAISRDENGVIVVDNNRCVSCYTCVMVCPYGHMYPDENRQIIKCDLCRENNGDPVCVNHCPNGALKLVKGGRQ